MLVAIPPRARASRHGGHLRSSHTRLAQWHTPAYPHPRLLWYDCLQRVCDIWFPSWYMCRTFDPEEAPVQAAISSCRATRIRVCVSSSWSKYANTRWGPSTTTRLRTADADPSGPIIVDRIVEVYLEPIGRWRRPLHQDDARWTERSHRRWQLRRAVAREAQESSRRGGGGRWSWRTRVYEIGGSRVYKIEMRKLTRWGEESLRDRREHSHNDEDVLWKSFEFEFEAGWIKVGNATAGSSLESDNTLFVILPLF